MPTLVARSQSDNSVKSLCTGRRFLRQGRDENEVMPPKISVYIATSLDGFIARQDGTLDWLEGSSGDQEPGEVENDDGGEDYGFYEFFDSTDTMVMGRGTYEFVAATGQWQYDEKRTIVLSSSAAKLEIPEHLAGKFEILSAEPADLVERLARDGARHIYVDGGITIQRFLRAGLVDELIVTRMPVLIGSGIPLFGELETDLLLEHVETHSFPNGVVQSIYRRQAS